MPGTCPTFPPAPSASSLPLAAAAGTGVKVTTIPHIALSALGLVMPVMRELKETWYQFAEPFVTDSTLTETTFGLTATGLAEGAAATVQWWRDQR